MRVALATVGTTGDVRPFSLLARALIDRGHEVTAITWPVHRAAFAAPGVRIETAGPHADPARIASVAAEAASGGPLKQVAVLRDFHLADGEAHYRRLRELLPGHDLVVLHGIHALAHAAVLDLDLAWATAVFDPVLLPTASAPPAGMPSLGPANRLLWAMLDRLLMRATRPLDAVLARAGSRQRRLPMFRARSPRLHLVACSPTLIDVPADLSATTHVTGDWVNASLIGPLPEPIESFLADGAPPIVVTFGSMAGAPESELRRALERLFEAGRRVIMPGPALDASPSLLSIGVVDHRALFPRAALVVHHGGAGTTHTACAAGVASVVVPHVGDQRYWAATLHRLGVAPPAIDVSKLDGARLASSAMAAASDPAMRNAAGRLAARMAGEDGLGASVRLLEAAGTTG